MHATLASVLSLLSDAAAELHTDGNHAAAWYVEGMIMGLADDPPAARSAACRLAHKRGAAERFADGCVDGMILRLG